MPSLVAGSCSCCHPLRKDQKVPCDSKGFTHTHTHTPPAKGSHRKSKVQTNVHVCAQNRQMNEDMKRGQYRPGVCGCNGEKPSDQGQPMSQTSCNNLGVLKRGFQPTLAMPKWHALVRYGHLMACPRAACSTHQAIPRSTAPWGALLGLTPGWHEASHT